MRVWCFSGPNGTGALTCDQAGSNLPTDIGPWRAALTLVLGSDREDEREATRLISEFGFCCFEYEPESEGNSPEA